MNSGICFCGDDERIYRIWTLGIACLLHDRRALQNGFTQPFVRMSTESLSCPPKLPPRRKDLSSGASFKPELGLRRAHAGMLDAHSKERLGDVLPPEVKSDASISGAGRQASGDLWWYWINLWDMQKASLLPESYCPSEMIRYQSPNGSQAEDMKAHRAATGLAVPTTTLSSPTPDRVPREREKASQKPN